MTANDRILDAYIRHQTYLLRYAGGLRNTILPLIEKTDKKLYDLIVKYISKAEGTSRTLSGAFGRKWQAEFTAAISELRNPQWQKVAEIVVEEMRELAKTEAATGASVIEANVPVVLDMKPPPTAQLVSIVNSTPFEGKTLKEWLAKTADKDVEYITSRAKIGIINGETPTQVARELAGVRKTGATKKAFRDMEALLLTVTNGVQQEAKQALYEANSDIIKKELFVATLDSRTTIICMGLDGKVFIRGEGAIPPMHFRCRSLRVPFINPENLNTRPFNSATEKQLVGDYARENGLGDIKKRGDLPRGHKTKYDKWARQQMPKYVGRVTATTSYNDWLKRQSADFQNDVLGPTRAKLFRKGDITLDSFTARSGDVLTLYELKAKGFDV